MTHASRDLDAVRRAERATAARSARHAETCADCRASGSLCEEAAKLADEWSVIVGLENRMSARAAWAEAEVPCPTCGRSVAPLRRAQAAHEERHRARRNAMRRDAKRAKRAAMLRAT